MPQVHTIQTNFSTGELTQKVAGQVDFEGYRSGAERLKNWIVHPQGGISRRGGTHFVAGVRVHANGARLIKFIFSQDDAYCLEFGDTYIRFYTDEGQVRESLAVTAGSWAGGTATLTIGTHSAVVGDTIVIEDVDPVGYNGTYIVTGIAATTVSYALTPDPGAWSSAGTVDTPLEVETPYAIGEVDQIQYVQSADILFLVHPDYEPRQLSRTSPFVWSLDLFNHHNGPFIIENITATTMTPSGATGSITVTASAATFATTDVGRLMRIRLGSTWGVVKFTGFTSSTVMDADVDTVETLGTPAATQRWAFGAWSDDRGWPESITFFQQRLSFGGTNTERQTVWMSQSSDFDNFRPTATDSDTVVASDAITITIDSNEVNKILWISASRKQTLFIGTTSAVRELTGGGTGGSMTATSVPFLNEVGSFGAQALIRPINIGAALLYVQRGGRKVRELTFDSEGDIRPVDLTILAEHITATNMLEIDYQDQPDGIYWGILTNGNLVGMTYARNEGIAAWHHHQLGGTSPIVAGNDFYSTGAGLARSLVSIPRSGRDQVWLVVERTINSVTKQYVEFMEPVFDADTIDAEDAFCVDSGLVYAGAATTALSGLDHLEAEEMEILGDAAVLPAQTVANGAITATEEVEDAVIGLSYSSECLTMRLALGNINRTIQGKIKRIAMLTFRFLNAKVLQYAENDTANLEEVLFRDAADTPGVAVPNFTGDKTVGWPGDSDTNGQAFFKNSGPANCSVLALITDFETDTL